MTWIMPLAVRAKSSAFCSALVWRLDVDLDKLRCCWQLRPSALVSLFASASSRQRNSLFIDNRLGAFSFCQFRGAADLDESQRLAVSQLSRVLFQSNQLFKAVDIFFKFLDSIHSLLTCAPLYWPLYFALRLTASIEY